MDILHHTCMIYYQKFYRNNLIYSTLILFQFLNSICADDAKHNKQPRNGVSQAVNNTSDGKLN
jgi:hypothetical protein